MRIGNTVRFTKEHSAYLKSIGRPHDEKGIALRVSAATVLVAWPRKDQRHFTDLLEEA